MEPYQDMARAWFAVHRNSGRVASGGSSPEAHRINTLVWNLDMLRNYDEGTPRPWYSQVKFWWALFFLGQVIIYWRFW